MFSAATQRANAIALDEYGLSASDLRKLLCVVADYRRFGVPITAREVNGMLESVSEQSSGGLAHLERRGFLRYVGKAEHPNSKMFVPTPMLLAKFGARVARGEAEAAE